MGHSVPQHDKSKTNNLKPKTNLKTPILIKMKHLWYKIPTALLLLYTVWGAFILPIPQMAILNETMRNLYFHVPMWFTMMVLFGISIVNSVLFLNTNNLKYDTRAQQSVVVGLLFAALGLLTGMVWAQYTWGTPWTSDPKLNGAAITTLMYLAYSILRNSIEDVNNKARISAVYNIFAFPMMVVLLFALPRINDSLHPGNGGNVGFSTYDLDNQLRMVFYPAVLAWIGLGVWIFQVSLGVKRLKIKNQ